MYLPRIIARFGLFSNVGRFMIIEKPQKLFFPTFVSDYNNPERYRNKDMKVNLNKGAIEGLFLEQGSSFLLLDEGGKPSPLHDYRELLIEHMRAEKFQSYTYVTNVPQLLSDMSKSSKRQADNNCKVRCRPCTLTPTSRVWTQPL